MVSYKNEKKNAEKNENIATVFKQLYLSKKARLWELQGKPAESILPLIDEGMAITFKNFKIDDIVDNVLVLEESELLHTKTRILATAGNYYDAISILDIMMAGLIKLPATDREKEKYT